MLGTDTLHNKGPPYASLSEYWNHDPHQIQLTWFIMHHKEFRRFIIYT